MSQGAQRAARKTSTADNSPARLTIASSRRSSSKKKPVKRPARERRLRELREIAKLLSRSRQSPLQICEVILNDQMAVPKIREFFGALPKDEKHYWIASLFALLIPPGRRRRLAAYFTPPHLVSRAIALLAKAGMKIGESRILDPSSGGAAFLVPLAARIAKAARRDKVPAKAILPLVEATLSGIEIDADLSALSVLLVSDMLQAEIAAARRPIKLAVRTANTLSLDPAEELFDAVIGNPPYGRLFGSSKRLRDRFAGVISQSYVNLYALFVEQSIRFVRPGGIICLVIPMSFIGGPHFAALRRRITETSQVLSLDPIDKRSDVFLDVLYDVGILLLRKGKDHPAPTPSSHLIRLDRAPQFLGLLDVPSEASDRVWVLPDGKSTAALFGKGKFTLSDYGYVTRTGYFVWNREQERYRTGNKPYPYEVPLFWAHNIRANRVCRPNSDTTEKAKHGFVRIPSTNRAVIQTDAIAIQRTSNRRQDRRLIAAPIRQAKVPGGRGFVSENHTILVLPEKGKKQLVSINVLCRLLNTAEVDVRFRRMSGSVSVSTKALRVLPLPAPGRVKELFRQSVDDEVAAKRAYSKTPLRSQKPRRRPKHS